MVATFDRRIYFRPVTCKLAAFASGVFAARSIA
ncbi:hypothetical protein GIV52_00430 [Pseudomonas syringae]|uniref:Uncharacterized protein n=3 Tax=Pseudomonas syringae group TaxID=136849 RepID=A0A9Q4FI10_PSESX|nr:hypothetical protein BKM19_005235 [Pseudomonas amygdali pv. morsprunorum]AVB18643.1 hypothetical protein BKM03_04690 [Pseudomonas avellanae]AXH58105.1 hypothetical protein PLA107_024775 [Pseudomonas amygdali pv. lachrymans str. M301315]KAA3537870.1 hypothetical protein DXU85_21775 [Pseudomonas savastanoi]MBL3829840.1 hypothetical protein [Pseudomonas syringae pv. theae]MCF5468786.1 hypothetical protein [Pseudomonas syringae]NVL59388.1 hypothetical protein [Pseudomonas syringae pv. actinidi